jgi:glutamate N-acetyltransferase/amino-acid N-acetyltransferase
VARRKDGKDSKTGTGAGQKSGARKAPKAKAPTSAAAAAAKAPAKAAKAATRATRAPAKVASAPAKTARAPAKTPAKAPTKARAKAQVKIPAKAPAKAASAPAKTSARTSAKTPTKTPAKAVAKAPAARSAAAKPRATRTTARPAKAARPSVKVAGLAAQLAERQKAQAALAAEVAALEAEIVRTTGKPVPKAKKKIAVSPFAPKSFPALPAVAGVRLASGAAGVRYKGRTDVMLAEIAAGAAIAGTFTRSETRAAPVLWCQERLAALAAAPGNRKIGIVVNSGNANAFTGRSGREAVEAVAKAAGKALKVPAGNVFQASTGVIGEPLPAERITASLATIARGLSPHRMEDAARAIMTTDTFPKGASTVVDLDDAAVTISGFCKGSGMIQPDMATMLVFIFTDAKIERTLLQTTVSELTDQTFNCITVDSDTSTSDTLLVAATGKARMPAIESRRDPRYARFRAALVEVMRELAVQVVKDGEGASKIVAITVTGARSDRAARKIGLSVANSPLVKTAIAGEDPNWGRVVMAVGKAGEAADRDRLSIRFGEILVAENGWVAESYSEELGAAYMKRDELEIAIDVGIGAGRATVWTCDLTNRYIEINADYRS